MVNSFKCNLGMIFLQIIVTSIELSCGNLSRLCQLKRILCLVPFGDKFEI